MELTLTALLPGTLALLGPATARAGRLSWLSPLLALPAGLLLCLVWRRLGREDLSRGLEEAFGLLLGRFCQFLYLLWGLLLLAVSARRYAMRLMEALGEQDLRWLFLLTALGLCLWLSRGRGGVLARTGRIFFLTTAVVLVLILLLALPALNWQNLWPPGSGDFRGLPAGAALSLSLSGYGVYALCLPRRPEGRGKAWPWAVWGALGVSGLLFIVVGTFGPALILRMEEPFLFLLEGVRVPGAFRRGEAALAAALALSDLTLLCLLTRGCRALSGGLVPGLAPLGPWLAAGAFLLAGCLPLGETLRSVAEEWVPLGNLFLGVLLPAFAAFTIKVRKKEKIPSTFSGDPGGRDADVGPKGGEEKSFRKNEKKC